MARSGSHFIEAREDVLRACGAMIQPQSSASWTLRKEPRDTGLVVPQWSVPLAPLNWEEPRSAYDGAVTRDRRGRQAHLNGTVRSLHPNRGKVDAKLPGPGHSTTTKSYNNKYADDPDPYNQAENDPRPMQRTILHEIKDSTRPGKFKPEHTGTFHPLYAYRSMRPMSFLREDTQLLQRPMSFAEADMKTLGNKSLSTFATNDIPARDKFSVDKRKEMATLVAPGTGQVGNRVGEATVSYRTSFSPSKQQTNKAGKPYESRGRFAQSRSGLATSQTVQAPCESDQPGLQKTRWPEMMLREDPPAKESRVRASAPSESAMGGSQVFRKTLRPSQSSGLEVGGGGPKLTASMRYSGRESRAVPPPVYIPPKLM
eukprot:COSAG02_NODE_38_length_48090_cov_107.207060_26_plen_371_part_00